jgi:hypothetical protein
MAKKSPKTLADLGRDTGAFLPATEEFLDPVPSLLGYLLDPVPSFLEGLQDLVLELYGGRKVSCFDSRQSEVLVASSGHTHVIDLLPYFG